MDAGNLLLIGHLFRKADLYVFSMTTRMRFSNFREGTTETYAKMYYLVCIYRSYVFSLVVTCSVILWEGLSCRTNFQSSTELIVNWSSSISTSSVINSKQRFSTRVFESSASKSTSSIFEPYPDAFPDSRRIFLEHTSSGSAMSQEKHGNNPVPERISSIREFQW